MARKITAIKFDPAKMKSLDEFVKEFTDTQILYLIGEMLRAEVDKEAEVEYADGQEPHHLIFKMKSGRNIAVFAMEIKQ